jgi:hypothetical protein
MLHTIVVGCNKIFERQFIMNKILQEAADDIANVFSLNNGWCDDKRMAVSKILEAMEAKILQTTNSHCDAIPLQAAMESYACSVCGHSEFRVK